MWGVMTTVPHKCHPTQNHTQGHEANNRCGGPWRLHPTQLTIIPSFLTRYLNFLYITAGVHPWWVAPGCVRRARFSRYRHQRGQHCVHQNLTFPTHSPTRGLAEIRQSYCDMVRLRLPLWTSLTTNDPDQTYQHPAPLTGEPRSTTSNARNN